MLRRHAKLFLSAVFSLVLILQDRRLLKHLTRVAKKIISLLREGDSLVCPVENHKVHLFFKFMNRICKARLGNVQPVCRLCDGSHLRYGYHIS